MMKFLLRTLARQLRRDFSYDPAYLDPMIAAGASSRMLAFGWYTRFPAPKGAEPIAVGALLASTFEGDCGPCTQLVIDMGRKSGVCADEMRACVEGRFDQAGKVGLGYRFAMAAITDAPELDELRAEIEAAHGPKAVVAAAIPASAGRVYPVLKRGLGYGHTCQKLHFGDADDMLTLRA